MAYKAEIKTTFEPRRVIQPIYTGGSIAIDRAGSILASCQDEDVLLSNLSTGDILARIESDGDTVTSLSLSPDARFLAISSRTTALRIYSLATARSDNDTITPTLTRTLKPHPTPVVVSTIDATGTLLATGGADGVVKIWDLRGGYTTHTFHGHSGVISALHFFTSDTPAAQSRTSKSRKRKSGSHHQQNGHGDMDIDISNGAEGLFLATGGDDAKIRIWDLNTRKSIATLDSHVSVVRSIAYCPNNDLLLSASRDKTVILWNVHDWSVKSTTPVLEGVERAGFVNRGRNFYTAGERGRVRIWTLAGQEKTEEQDSGLETEAIVDVLHAPDLPFLLSVHADQMLILHSLDPLADASVGPGAESTIPPLPVMRRIYGTHDEVIDLAYIGRESNIMALATNSEDMRLVSIQEPASADSAIPPFGTDIGLLKGHEDIIITIDTDWSGHWLATGAKDNTTKLWRLDTASKQFECYTTLTGHAESISAVALSHDRPVPGSKAFNDPLSHPPSFIVTGSQDKTIKKWDIPAPSSSSSSFKAPRAVYTRKAHDKDINAIDVSPSSSSTNTSLIATASQDRTTKIWDLETGETIGVLRGHKRGVWSVAFAPVGTPGITSSDGAASSGSKGMILTGSGDKTVRIWSLNDYSCLRTFEGHTNSVLKVVWLPRPKQRLRANADGAQQRPSKSSQGVQVASAAGDGLVKIWNAQQDECAATLDNHTDRVWALAVNPFPEDDGTKNADTAMNDIDSSSSLNNEDEDADDEAEASATLSPEASLELVSGSADSTLTFWTDTTSATSLASATLHSQRVEQDQALSNAIFAGKYREAIVLALEMNHPKRLLDLFTRVVASGTAPGAGVVSQSLLPPNTNHGKEEEEASLTGSKEVDKVLASLSKYQLYRLLLRLRDWNSNARSSAVAQRIMYALFRLYPKSVFVGLERSLRRKRMGVADADDDGDGDNGDEGDEDGDGDGGGKEGEQARDGENNKAGIDRNRDRASVKDIIEGLLAYTEKHAARLEKMSEQRHVLAWTLQMMDDTAVAV